MVYKWYSLVLISLFCHISSKMLILTIFDNYGDDQAFVETFLAKIFQCWKTYSFSDVETKIMLFCEKIDKAKTEVHFCPTPVPGKILQFLKKFSHIFLCNKNKHFPIFFMNYVCFK